MEDSIPPLVAMSDKNVFMYIYQPQLFIMKYTIRQISTNLQNILWYTLSVMPNEH